MSAASAAPSAPLATLTQVGDLLAQYRARQPSSSELETALPKLWDFLQYYGGDNERKEADWFTPRWEKDGGGLVRETAAFLLRLHAYNADAVHKWKAILSRQLAQSPLSINGHEDAKERARTVYLCFFKPATQANFFGAVLQWEKSLVSPHLPSSPADLSTFLPPAALHHILANLDLLLSPDVLSIVLPSLPLTLWKLAADVPPPPGLFLLLALDSGEAAAAARDWARHQLLDIGWRSVSLADSPRYKRILGGLLAMIEAVDKGGEPQEEESRARLPLVRVTRALWDALACLLATMDRNAMEAALRNRDGQLVRLVLGHLHDQGDHFPSVLHSFFSLLRTKSTLLTSPITTLTVRNLPPSAFSRSTSTHYVQLLVDAVLDNPAYESLLLSSSQPVYPSYDLAEPGPLWTLAWWEEYIRSSWDMPVLHEALASLARRGFEEMLQPRWENRRVDVLMNILRILHFVHDATVSEKPFRRREFLHAVLDIHASVVVDVAFGPAYAAPLWTPPRDLARDLIQLVFVRDADAILSSVLALGSFYVPWGQYVELKERGSSRAVKPNTTFNEEPVKIAKSLWQRTYEALRKATVEDAAVVIQPISIIAHLEPLDTTNIYRLQAVPQDNDHKDRDAFQRAAQAIGPALQATLDPFASHLERFATSTRPERLLELLSQPGMPQALVRLLLSPRDAIPDAAQAFVREALDAYTRSECFGELLRKYPIDVLDGICAFIRSFIDAANQLPEATIMAKRMVRCFADVIDVLCSPTEGLLRFHLRNVQGVPRYLLRFWSLTCEANALIFLQSTKWHRFFANEVMTEWMRDALILAREMLECFRLFESAIAQSNGPSDSTAPSPARLTNNGRKMVSKLDDVLRYLTGWLRLTDTELLYQSFQLILTLLDRFARNQIMPSKDLIETLQAFANKARGHASKLSKSQQSQLTDAISPFVDEPIPISDDDEVAMIEPSAPKARVQAQSTTPRTSSSPAPLPPTASTSKASSNKPGKRDITSYFSKVSTVPKATSREPKPHPFMTQRPTKPELKPAAKPAPTAAKLQSKMMAQLRDEYKEEHRRGQHAAAMVIVKHPSRPVAPTTKTLRYHGNKQKDESSNESEVCSDDDDAGGLAGLAAIQREPKIHKPRAPERRQIKVLGVDNKVFKTPGQRAWDEQQQRAHRKLRLTPDLSQLHREILQWDYDAEGDMPPSRTALAQRLKAVPDIFASPQVYNEVMEPLLMLECWSQLSQAKEQLNPGEAAECEVAGKSFVDDWLEIHLSIKAKVPQGWFINDVDVVLLTRAGAATLANGKEFRVIAKVQSFTKRLHEMSAVVRCCLGSDANSIGAALADRTKWNLNKLFSLSTIHREYAALKGMQYYDLRDHIFKPKLALKPRLDRSDVDRTMANYQVNEPQAKAILSTMALDPKTKQPLTPGFSLIQGPPGTGKSKTILGLIAKFVAQRPREAIEPDRNKKPDKAAEKPILPKILVCAPSNAAIDEIARRLMDPVRGERGNLLNLNVVRIGAEASMNISVKDISLDELVDQKLNAELGNKNDGDGQATIASLRAELEKVRHEINDRHAELNTIVNNTAKQQSLEATLRALKARRATLSQMIDEARDKNLSAGRARDAARRRLRIDVLCEADVICSTLSGAGHEVLASLPFGFETVVIDEAAQAIELSALIPLKYDCKRAILVGDPDQLPPTVLSQKAAEYNYSQSLFVRLMKQRTEAVHLLSIQYRMHPEISVLPSKLFYQSRLTDGPGMADKCKAIWHTNPLFGAYKFFNVQHGQEEAGRGHSLVNRAEAEMAVSLYQRLMREYGEKAGLDYRVAVVTMYKEQVFELKRRFRQRFGHDVLNRVDINTVDGFQGQEKAIIILCCVRGGPGVSNVGFLGDVRRMNVALTRAQSSLFVLGHAPTLERSNMTWRTIVQDARDRGLLVTATPTYFTSPSNAAPAVLAAPKGPKKERQASRPASTPAPGPELVALGQAPKVATSASVGNLKKRAAETADAPSSVDDTSSSLPSFKKLRVDGSDGAALSSTVDADSDTVMQHGSAVGSSSPVQPVGPAHARPSSPTSAARSSSPAVGPPTGPSTSTNRDPPPPRPPVVKKRPAPNIFLPKKPIRKPQNPGGPGSPRPPA